MTSSHLRAGDVDAMLRIVDDGRRDDPAKAMPWAVLETLQRLVPCDGSLFFLHADLQECRDTVAQGIRGGMRFVDDEDCGPDDPFWSLFWGSRYCSYPQASGDLVSVIQEADFYGTDQERRNDPMQNDLMRPIGCTHSMIMSMPAPAGQMRRLLFWRSSGPGFGERDRQVVTLLRPHLYEIWLAAERRRNNVPRLTGREWEVLRLSAAGLSNAEIAGQLVISVGTVRKHIEHILSRLGVHNRSVAAALALPHDPQLHQQVGPGTSAIRSAR
jgi:DNA-binding CsgD family transcriptional regulator